MSTHSDISDPVSILMPVINSHHEPEDIVSPNGLTKANQKIYLDMINHMKLKLQRPFTAPKIVMLISNGIKFLAKVKTLSGPTKKDLVLHAIRETVQRSSYINDSEKVKIIMLVDTFGDCLIELLVEFAYDTHIFIKNKLKGISWCTYCINGQIPTSNDRSIANNLEEYEGLKRYIKLKLQRPISGPKVINVIATGVKYIERYSDLSGAEKKDIVIHVIRDVISEADFISVEDKTGLIIVIDTFADDTIEYLVDYGKNMYLKIKTNCCRKMKII